MGPGVFVLVLASTGRREPTQGENRVSKHPVFVTRAQIR